MSNYPDKIDSSIELPVVRNNVLEAGSEAINSIRNAVINIERAVGISPQGSKNSLSERISVSLDSSGNLKDSALRNLNVVSGPIDNSDVSINAKISESKIDLDYSTEHLNSQIKIISSLIDSVYNSVADIKSQLSLHINSLNAHKGSAISISSIARTEKSSANSFPVGDLQSFLDDSLNSHYNFSGPATSSNRSHSSDQIYVDSSTVDGASSDNLQDVLSELSTKGEGSVANFIHNYKNSHFPTKSVIGNRYLEDNILHENVDISYSKFNTSSGNSGSTVTLVSPIESRLRPGDTCEIFDQEYVISKITYSSNNVSSVFLENFFPDSSSLNVSANFISKIKDLSSEVGLTYQTIRNPITSDKSFIQIVNPNSPYIVADTFPKYSELQSANSVSININSETFSISFSASSNIENIIDTLNNESVSQNAPIMFFKYDGKIGISSLIISNDSYIKLNSSSSVLGFSNTNKHYGNPDGIILIGRREENEIKEIINGSFLCENSVVTSNTVDFLSLGISTSSYLIVNDRRYFIESVTSTRITLHNANFTSGNYTVSCYDDSTSISMFANENVFGDPGFEGAFVKGYLDSEFRLSIFKFCDFLVPVDQSQRSELLIDFDILSDDMKEENIVIRFQVDNSDDDTIYIIFGDVKIPYFGKYSYFGKNNLNIFSDNIDALRTHIKANQNSFPKFYDAKINIKPIPYYDKIDLFSVKINKSSKYVYEGLVEVNRGYLNKDNISFSLNSYQNYERSLVSSNSIISGFEISSVSLVNGFYSINLESGKYIYNGKIYEIPNSVIQTRIQASLSDNIFVYIDNEGVPSAIEASANLNSQNCYFPLDTSSNMLVGSVEYISGTLYHYSLLNYHVDGNDLVVGNIFVDPHRGAVRTIGRALELSRKYYKAFRKHPGKIILSPSVHHINVEYSGSDRTSSSYTSAAWDAGIYLDFPITIEGSGFRTVIDASISGSADRVERFADFIVNFDTDNDAPGGSVEGKVIFKDLTFDNTGVQIKNNNPGQSNLSLLDNFVHFESVRFSASDNSNNDICRILFNNSDVTSISGNCSFKNCDFVNYNINFGNSDGEIIHGLSICNSRFKFQSGQYGIKYSTGRISFYDSSSYGFIGVNSTHRKNNYFAGNSLLSSCGSWIATNISPLSYPFETTFGSIASYGKGWFSGQLTALDGLVANGSTRIQSGDLLFSYLNTVRFVGSNTVEFRNRQTGLDRTSVVLADSGTISGFQRVRYSCTFNDEINNEDTSTRVYRHAFNFYGNEFINTYQYDRNKEVDMRLCSNASISNSLFLRNIQICPGLVLEGEEFDVKVTIAYVTRQLQVFSSTPTYSRGPRSFSTGVITATNTVSVGASNSYSSINVDIEDAINESSDINSRIVSSKDLAVCVEVYFPSGGETDPTDIKFNVILDVDVK